MRATHIVKVTDYVIAIAFVICIAVPGLLFVTGRAKPDAGFIKFQERRAPAQMAPVTWRGIIDGTVRRSLEASFADAFPFRDTLVEDYNTVVFLGFGGDTSADVIRGRDGWLFYAEEEARYLRGDDRPDATELDYEADVYRHRARWCAQHGVHYVLMFAPNKSTIYSAMLPPTVHRVTPTVLDELLPRLHAAGVDVVDVRGVLEARARHEQVYSRGDTHWNDAGAYEAYDAIMHHLAPLGIRETLPRTLVHASMTIGSGDLYAISGVGFSVHDVQTTYTYPVRAHQVDASSVTSAPDATAFTVAVRETGDPTLPSAVFFNDSFGARLVPFLAENFRRSVELWYAHEEFDEHVILAERPRVVVQEVVERRFALGVPLDQ